MSNAVRVSLFWCSEWCTPGVRDPPARVANGELQRSEHWAVECGPERPLIREGRN